MEQVERRLLKGGTIPHGEKVFSIFEPHTRWVVKGKEGTPVELGGAGVRGRGGPTPHLQ